MNNMRRYLSTIGLLVLSVAFMNIVFSCKEDEIIIDQTIEVEISLNLISSEWGKSFEQVKSHMDGYTLIKSVNNSFLMYSDKDCTGYISYKFVDDSLCCVTLLAPQTANDLDLSGVLKGFSYVGELDNAKVYHNSSKNILFCTYEVKEKGATYQAFGFTPIFPTEGGTGDGNSRGEENGHEYVDLGLPSGTLWATCNIGATKPEDYGGYFAWGETTSKVKYSMSTYSYNIEADISDTEYDVAHVKWGGSWRMPTYNELYELCAYCDKEWTTSSGVKGYKFTGPNGEFIFLPAGGEYNYEDGFTGATTSIQGRGVRGEYWSGTYAASDQHDRVWAAALYWQYIPSQPVYDYAPMISNTAGSWGCNVRAVCQ